MYLFVSIRVLLFILCTQFCDGVEHNENDKNMIKLIPSGPPIIGHNFTLSCLIPDQIEWSASWSKNFEKSISDCTSKFCRYNKSPDGKYFFSSNESGTFISINSLTPEDAGNWTCSISQNSDEIHKHYLLEERNMIYPPTRCDLLFREKSYHCFSPCVKAENFTMTWHIDEKTFKAEDVNYIQSDCDVNAATKYNTTFKNYTSIIKTNDDAWFSGKGQVSCSCGIDGFSETFIYSSTLEANFCDKMARFFLVSILIWLLLCVSSNGIIYWRNRTQEFFKEWLCIILVNSFVILLISVVASLVSYQVCRIDLLVIILVISNLKWLLICCIIVRKKEKARRSIVADNIDPEGTKMKLMKEKIVEMLKQNRMLHSLRENDFSKRETNRRHDQPTGI